MNGLLKVARQKPRWIYCRHCSRRLPHYDGFIQDYFRGLTIKCGYCKAELDRWDELLRTVQNNSFSHEAFAAVGAEETVIEIVLRRNEAFPLKLSDAGVPPDARIVHINYTPNGHLFPLEMHGNVPTRHVIRNEIFLYPWPARVDEDKLATGKVTVFVTWLKQPATGESWDNLLAAFDAYTRDAFNSTLIPANVAVESALARLMKDLLRGVDRNDRVERFLTEAATYSYQLNIVLPLVAGYAGIRPMPDHLRQHLNRLRKLRNEMAHDGKSRHSLTKAQAAELVTAALFGVRYVDFFRDEYRRRKGTEVG